MKTEKQKTGKSTVEQLRDIRDKVSAETQNITFEQLQQYIEERLTETLHPDAAWRKRGDIAL